MKAKFWNISLILYCLVIFILSSIPGEDFPKVDFEYSDKIVHIIIYSILCVLFFYSLKNQSKYVNLQKFSLEFAVLFTALYGITDELHQYFVPNRSCEFADWVADLTGGLIVYCIIKLYYYKKKKLILILLSVLLAGCSASNVNTNQTKEVKITEEEAWLNLMPVIGALQNIFGFSVKVDFDNVGMSNPDYTIKDFTVYFNNDTLTGKKFHYESVKKSDITTINLTQDNTEHYLNKDKVKPREAQFAFSIYNGSKKIKQIRTSKLKINPVY